MNVEVTVLPKPVKLVTITMTEDEASYLKILANNSVTKTTWGGRCMADVEQFQDDLYHQLELKDVGSAF